MESKTVGDVEVDDALLEGDPEIARASQNDMVSDTAGEADDAAVDDGSQHVRQEERKEANPPNTATNNTLTHHGPLSWSEARGSLRQVLEDYMDTPLPVVKSNDDKPMSCWQRWFRWDMDFYAGALPMSIALLILSATSLSARKRGETGLLNASASITIYRAQVAASALLLAGTLFSIFLTKRREYTFAHDSDVAKRTTIAKFLKSDRGEGSKDSMDGSFRSKEENVATESHQINHPGTSRTDIYPTYRQGTEQQGWHRIPTLLLVKGDYVALQVGDVAPARCKLLGPDNNTPCVIDSGERITFASFGDARPSPTTSFPRGKITVPPQSPQLLELCNHMSVFVLEETPLEAFLYLPHAKQRLPQLHRQLKVIRQVVFLFAVFIFVVTIAIIFVRPGATSSDLSLVIHAPFLAALAVLPVTIPACIFSLEVIGTARILTKVHPHVASRHDDSESQAWLFIRYLVAITSSRLYLQELLKRWKRFIRSTFRLPDHSTRTDTDEEAVASGSLASQLVRIPPASTFLLEKLGVATAFTILDDELACEPYSIPQQLLIPSSNGLKLLDLCPTYESDSEDESEGLLRSSGFKRGRSHGSSPQDGFDSDSDDEHRFLTTTATKRTIKAIRRRRRKRKVKSIRGQSEQEPTQDVTLSDDIEVQFEDPLWWHYLPSLKCIGLACSLVDDHCNEDELLLSLRPSDIFRVTSIPSRLQMAERALVDHVCSERERMQLQLLARCIGLTANKNSLGERGDLSFFTEKLRVNVVSTKLLNERLLIDAHALGLEESRTWGSLQPDSSSVIVEDSRSNAYQLLTVGDPRVVTGLCHEAWQGENSTILPLTSLDRNFVLDTSNSWALADLDVAAFAYSPIPRTMESRLGGTVPGSDCTKTVYMVDNSTTTKDPVSDDWALIGKQIFLGVLGSSVIPRKEIEKLLETFDSAGVRFVYFSPRNMRRTKELASQMGIDVAWNCAISLRELDEGEEDPHRMVSAYADWSINAKLPHGIVNVRKHLEEVDNVPLLVSLFTDATKESTMDMIQTFQEYNDIVVSMGLSHLPRNAVIFSTADISVGADVLAEELAATPVYWRECDTTESLSPCEVEFVAAVSAHSCVFSLRGAASSSLMPSIIETARAALEAAMAATCFLLFGSTSLSIYILFCMCSAATAVPFVPTLGSALYLQIILPLIGLGLAMGDSDDTSMHRVPPKNDQSITFSRNEGARLYTNTLFKALLPSIFTYVLYLIAFGELMIKFEPELLQRECSVALQDIKENRWTSVIRCDALKAYSGEARTSAGVLILSEMVLCIIIGSASFVHATASILELPPWSRNLFWPLTTLLSIALVTIYIAVALENGSFSALSWYFFFLAALAPFLCLLGNELIKRSECKHIERAAKLRRLQFETRLGMWSPK